MGVVKSNSVWIKIVLILFSSNRLLVNSQDWTDPYFSDAGTDHITFQNVANGEVKLTVDEELGPSTLVIVNYKGDTPFTIDDSQSSNKFLQDCSPKLIKEEDHWIITIEKSIDYEESIQKPQYQPRLNIDGTTKTFYVNIKNLDDSDPSLEADQQKCTVSEDFLGDTDCIYTIRDPDGCVKYTEINILGNPESDTFSLVMDDQNDFDYPLCLDQRQKDIKAHLVVKKGLDFETIRNYFLEVEVKDPAGHKSSVQIIINLADVADVEPIWTGSISTFTVEEQTEVTFQLTAKDGDTSIDAPICYSLTVETAGVTDEEKAYFEIGEKTGLVTIHKIDRDFYKQNTYALRVFAYECDDPTSITNTSVTILVKDKNNKSPEICIRNTTDEEHNDCLGQVEIYLEEGKTTTLSGISIEITDPDEGDAGTFKVTLEDDPPSSSLFKWYEAFQIIPSQGYQEGTFTISVADASKLDYEHEDWRDIKLNVVAVEEENKDHSNKIPISIMLINLNDELPVFSNLDGNGALSVSVKENLPINSAIFTVIATDADGPEDKVTFTLSQAKGLTIDSDTGVITTSSDKTFDFELQQQMVVQVYAEDSMGGVHNQAFTTLTITVVDENDVPPQISLSASTIEVLESEEIGFTLPVDIIGTDVDTTSSLELRIDWDASTGTQQFVAVDLAVFKECYDINGEYDTDGNFVGKLTIAKKLSWNDVDTIKLVLIVEDLKTDIGDRTKQVTLSINIRDVNDHNPVFDSCDGRVLSVTENTNKDVRIKDGQITAHDDDSSENGNNIVTYLIKPKSEDYENYISIDENSGYLYTGSALIDFEKYQTLEYTVIAHNENGPDGGDTTCEITIGVTDLNDNIPTKDSIEKETVDVLEDATTGYHITDLIYHDDDITPAFKKIKFELGDKNLQNYFKINDKGDGTAELVVDFTNGGKFDYDEGDKSYDVQIKIYDNPDREEGGEQNPAQPLPTIRVNLVDVNDNVPVFIDGGSSSNNPKSCFIQANEDKKKGDHLDDSNMIEASDKDSGDFGTISYNLVSVTCLEDTNYGCLPPEEAKELFEVAKSGIGQKAYIAAKKNLLNLFGEYILEITANDQGKPPQYSDSNFYKVCILDVNDHQPSITYPDVDVLIIKKGAGGGIVLNDDSAIPLFTAVDEDYGVNADVTFSLAASAEADFFQLTRISESTARFELKDGKTFEDLEKDLYSLTVKACNNEETDCTVSRSLSVYKTTSEEVEPVWQDADQEVTYEFKEGDINDPQNHYVVPKATDSNDIHIPGLPDFTQPIFYYIKSGNDDYASFFEIDPKSGSISLINPLDCEYRTEWTLKIQASNYDDITHVPPNPDPKSLLTLLITVYDINDKFPKFGQDVYMSSVSADFDVFLQVEATDPDKGDSVKYGIVPGSLENHVTGGSEIDWNTVFDINSKTGALSFNAKIDPSFTGYLTLNISATDLKSHQDVCFVKVYIISASVKVPFDFRNTREQVYQNQNQVAEVFSQFFNHECVVGKIESPPTNGTDGPKTTMNVHFTDENGDPVPVSEIEIIKGNTALMQNLTNELLSKFNLYLTGFGQDQGTAEPEENYLVRTVLIAVCAVLGALLIAMLAMYIIKTRNLRKLVGNLTKATAPQEDKERFALPNTNQYSNEGSNPVFNANINTQKLDQLDNASLSSNDSSLIGIEDNPEFQAFYNNVILKNEGKTDDDVLKENPQLNAFRNSDDSAFNF